MHRKLSAIKMEMECLRAFRTYTQIEGIYGIERHRQSLARKPTIFCFELDSRIATIRESRRDQRTARTRKRIKHHATARRKKPD